MIQFIIMMILFFDLYVNYNYIVVYSTAILKKWSQVYSIILMN